MREGEGGAARLLAAAGDGSLLVLGPDPEAGPGATWQVLQAHKGFAGRGKVSGLLPLPGAGGLLVSWDGREGARLHRLAPGGACEPVGEGPGGLIPRTRGCRSGCVHPGGDLLCLSAKHKLLFYRIAPAGAAAPLEEVREVPTVETARCMAFCGPQTVILGGRRSYTVLCMRRWQVSDMFPTGRNQVAITAATGPDEVLVGKDTLGVYVGPDGRPSREHGLSWSEAPLDAVVAQPYVVGRLPRAVEVRSLQMDVGESLVQTISLRGMALASQQRLPNGAVALASADEVHLLVPVPLPKQVATLMERGEYVTALDMCRVLRGEPHGGERRTSGAGGSEPEVSQDEIEAALNQRYAFHLFAQGQYKKAMDHFRSTSLGPKSALGLLPTLLPSSAALAAEAAAPPPGMEAGVDLGEEDLKAAADAVLSYLLDARLVIQNSSDASPRASTLPKNIAVPEPWGDPEGWGGVDIAALVDTAIVKALLSHGEGGILLGFLQSSNHVILDDGIDCLKETGSYAELVEFYRQREMHREALELLQQVALEHGSLSATPRGPAADPKGEMAGPLATIRYLAALGAEQRDLVLEFSVWVLTALPKKSLDIFLSPKVGMPPGSVLDHLKAHAPRLQVTFLERALEGVGTDSEICPFENALALLYLEQALAGGRETEDSRKKLRLLLAESVHVVPEGILTSLPEGKLLEERALALSRMRRHRQALDILISDIDSVSEALSYCDRVWTRADRERQSSAALSSFQTESHVASTSVNGDYRKNPEFLDRDLGVYQELMHTLVASGGKGVSAAVDLACHRFERMDPIAVLDMLPGNTPLSDLVPFVEGVLQRSSRDLKHWTMARNLVRQEEVQAKVEWVTAQRKCVQVTDVTACALCNRRVGNAVFVQRPQGDVVHFLCYKKSMKGAPPRSAV